MNRLLFVAAALTLALSACAPAAPAIDPAQVQASAVAAAEIMIAQTRAAVPTATPIPPTDVPSPTPLPSPTLELLPTIQVISSPTSSTTGSTDCNHAMDVGSAGPKAPVLINNDTKGPISFTLYLGSKNSFGQCGWLSWGPIAKANSIMVDVPYARLNQGDPCYWASAYVNDPKQPSQPSNGPFCLNNPDKWTFDVSYDRIKLTPP